VAEAGGLRGDNALAQRDSILAVAERVAELPNRDEIRDELADLAREKTSSGALRRPWAAWQKDVDRRFPKMEGASL
jgi:hypothetical protein